MPQQLTLAQARNEFFKAANLRSQTLPRQTYNANQSVYEFTLPKAGYGNYCVIDFQGTLAITGTGGSLAISGKAPYNLFSSVVFNDFLGTTRINASGWRLYEREVATKWAFDENNVNSQDSTVTLETVSIGGGTGAAGSYPLNSSAILPIALHHMDTRGSFAFAVPQGENTVSITMNSLVGSTLDSLLIQNTAGFTVSLTGTIGITYYYWDVPKGTPLPSADFALIHEIREIRESDNMSQGTAKTFTLPTGRTYFQLIQDVVANGALDTADITRVRFLIDGATPTLDEFLFSYQKRTRRSYGRDFPKGMFLFDFWRKQWTPENYGSLQTELTLSNSITLGTNYYTSVLLESLYQANNVVVA